MDISAIIRGKKAFSENPSMSVQEIAGIVNIEKSKVFRIIQMYKTLDN